MKRRKELLRKQMELLAEQSVTATESELYKLSVAMCEINRELERPTMLGTTLFALGAAMGLDFLIGVLIHVK